MEIHFEITEQCILECRHCSSIASEMGRMMDYTEEDIIRFLNQIEEEKEIYLTGGEPLLYPNLEGFLRKLKNRVPHLDIGLFTTGIVRDNQGITNISREYAKALAKAGLKVCYISIYSHNEEGHDWMTKLKGSFRLLNKSIKFLQEAGVEIRFNSVVTAKNIQNYEKILEYAEKMGVTEVRMLKLIRHGRACNSWTQLGIGEEQYREVVTNHLKRRGNIRITASGMTDMLPCRYQYKFKECPACKHLLYITSKGEVFPCASVKRKEEYFIGNIKDIDIFEKCKLYKDKMNGKMLCV